MEILFILAGLITLVCIGASTIAILMLIFSKTEENKKTAKNMLLYSIIGIVIGFGSCVGGLLLS